MFQSNRWYPVLVLLALCGLFLTSCSDDDPAAPGDDGDTTAPTVSGTDPVAGNPSVAADQPVVISFSEAMDTATATGQVTLSVGNITTQTWSGGNKDLQVDHADWTAGQEVTVTVGTGLKDVAGNALARAYSFSFHVFINQVLVVGSNPDPGATGFPVDGQVTVQFNRDMDVTTLETGITMTTPGKGAVPFTVQALENSTYALVTTADFPFDTPVTVNVGTSCTTTSQQGSEALAEAFNFTFQTALEQDITAPEILGIVPASGTTIPAGTSEIVITFSEPVDPDQFGFLLLNFQLLFAVELTGSIPSFNGDNTVMTIPLATPLPGGVRLLAQMDDFTDPSGNVNDSHEEWEVMVAGIPDHYPIHDDYAFAYYTEYENSDPEPGKGAGHYTRWDLFQWVTATDFRRYETEDTLVLEEWDYMTRTNDEILLRGFHELDEGVPMDIMFDEPVTYLNRPMVPASWNGSVTLSSGGEEATVNYSVRVLEGTTEIFYGDLNKVDRTWALADKADVSTVFWSDCRTVILDHDVNAGTEMIESGSDTMYYCPGFGLVKFAVTIQEADPPWEEWQRGTWSDLQNTSGLKR